MQKSFLLITPDASLAAFLRESLEPSGFHLEWRQSPPTRVRSIALGKRPIIMDLNMPDARKSIADFKAYHPDARIMVVTNGDPRKTDHAIAQGAGFVIPGKDAPVEALKEIFRRAHSELAMQEELERLRAVTEQRVIARSAHMKKAIDAADEAGPLDEPVLFFGEQGGGREFLARRVHARSQRAGMPFVAVFKDEEFIPAVKAARGGTLFINELAVISPETLEGVRGLLTKNAFYAGEDGPVKADVRFMAGCASPDCAFGLMDLNFVPVQVPTLAEREEDIIPLADCFLEELARYLKQPKKHLTRSAREALLQKFRESGSASELKGLMQRAYFFAKGQGITEKDLFGSDYIGRCSFRNFLDERLKGYIRKMAVLDNSNLYDTVVGEVEKSLIELALAEMKGNKVRAAKALGMNRNTFRAKIKQLKIKEFKDANP